MIATNSVQMRLLKLKKENNNNKKKNSFAWKSTRDNFFLTPFVCSIFYL